MEILYKRRRTDEPALDERLKFHEMIERNQLDKVKTFVDANPKMKFAYNDGNKCALTTALEAKSFEIYSFLRSTGFASGVDAEFEKVLKKISMNDEYKIEMSITNRKYFHTNDNQHIMDLLSKSRLGFEYDQKNFGKIQKWFETLDTIPAVRAILKLVSNSTVDIVFDLNKDLVCDMDPTQLSDTFKMKGLTTYDVNVLIGAKGEETVILATMAHEFTHLAMHLLYGNLGYPYFHDDKERKQKVDRIIVDCCDKHDILPKNKVIVNVFNCYDEDEHAKELIATVPELMVLHMNDKKELEAIRENYKVLFDFFDNCVLKDINDEIPLVKAKQRIANLNNQLGIFTKFEKAKFCSSDIGIDFAEIIECQENISIQSNVPEITLTDIIKKFEASGTKNIESLHIFMESDQILDPRNHVKIKEAVDSVMNPKIFVLQSPNKILNSDDFKKALNNVGLESKVVLIANKVLTCKELREITVDHRWTHLTEESQDEILKRTIKFHGIEIALGEIMNRDAKLLNEQLSLENVLILHEIEVEPQQLESPAYFVQRTLNLHDGSVINQTTEAVKLIQDQKVAIFAESAGWGKTTYATQIAMEHQKLHPSTWTVFVDLKQYTKAFIKDEDQSSININAEFFSKNLLKLRNATKQKLFEHFYEDAKTFFVFDGFDEISPSYKNFVMRIIKAVQDSRNRLLVTTRTQFEEELEEKLGTKAIKLMAFSEDDQIEFLMKLWHEKSPHRTENDLKSEAEQILEKFRNIFKADFLKIPLQLFMLAEVGSSEENAFENSSLNIFSLYKSFVTKKIEIWNQKGPLAQGDNTKIQMNSSNVLQMHQRIALEYFFGEEVTKSLELPGIPSELTAELISRVGLVRIGPNGKFYFVHQSYAEFLVAFVFLTHIHSRSSNDSRHKLFSENFAREAFRDISRFINDGLVIKDLRLEPNLQSRLKHEIEEDFDLFRELVVSKQNNLITLVWNNLNLGKRTKRKLLRHKDVLRWSFSHFDTFKVLWECIQEVFSQKEQKDFVLKDFDFHCAIENGCYDVLELILNFFKEAMDLAEFRKFVMEFDDERFGPITYSLYFGQIRVFDILWNAVRQRFDDEAQRQILIDVASKGGHIKFKTHSAKAVFNLIKNLFVPIRESENFTDFRNILSISFAKQADSEVFEDFWRCVTNKLQVKQQKTTFIKKNGYQETTLMASCSNKDFLVVKFVFGVANCFLKPDEFVEALLERGAKGDSALCSAFLAGTIAELFKLIEHFKIELPLQRILEHLLEYKSENILRKLIYEENDLKAPWNFLIEHLDPVDVKRLLFPSGTENAFVKAIDSRNNLVFNMLDWYKSSFGVEELKELFMNQNDRFQNSLFHHLAEYGYDETFYQNFFSFVSSNFCRSEIKAMLLAENDKGKVPLECTFEIPSYLGEPILSFWKFYDGNLDSVELEKLIFNDRRNLLKYNNPRWVRDDLEWEKFRHENIKKNCKIMRDLVIQRFGAEKVRQALGRKH